MVSLRLAFGTWQEATGMTLGSCWSRGTDKAAKHLWCLQPSSKMVCSHHSRSSQSHSQDCTGNKKQCWYLPSEKRNWILTRDKSLWCIKFIVFFKLFGNVYWKVPTKGISVVLSVLSLVSPHLKDPALSPPGIQMHPLLSTLPQETVASKSQKPSHKANGKLIAVFSIGKNARSSFFLNVRFASENVYSVQRKKWCSIRMDRQKGSWECFCLRRSLQKAFLPCLVPYLLGCCTGQEKSAQSVQVQLNTFFNHQSPKEFRPRGSDQDLFLLQCFKGIPFLSCTVQTRLPEQMTAPFWTVLPLLRAPLQAVSTWSRVFTKVIWIFKHSDSAALAKDFNCISQALCSLC